MYTLISSQLVVDCCLIKTAFFIFCFYFLSLNINYFISCKKLKAPIIKSIFSLCLDKNTLGVSNFALAGQISLEVEGSCTHQALMKIEALKINLALRLATWASGQNNELS